MRSRPSSLAAALAFASALALGCSSSTPKPADDPGDAKDAPPSDQAPPASTGEKADEAPPPAPMLKNGPAKDESVPDDYELTPGDCDALGKQYGRLARGDQLAALNPKLTQAQRETAESNIDRAITPLEGRWIDGCVASLAGKVSNRASLKCAMEAKTVKAFDVCLNGDAGPAPADPKPGAGPKKKK